MQKDNLSSRKKKKNYKKNQKSAFVFFFKKKQSDEKILKPKAKKDNFFSNKRYSDDIILNIVDKKNLKDKLFSEKQTKAVGKIKQNSFFKPTADFQNHDNSALKIAKKEISFPRQRKQKELAASDNPITPKKNTKNEEAVRSARSSFVDFSQPVLKKNIITDESRVQNGGKIFHFQDKETRQVVRFQKNLNEIRVKTSAKEARDVAFQEKIEETIAEIRNSQEIKNESSDDFIRNIKYIQYS